MKVRTQMNKQNKTHHSLLASLDVNASLRELVRLSKSLIELTGRETQALVTNDHMSFAFIGQDKEAVAKRYTKSSEDFRDRLEEFRNADKSILMQLNKLQNELKEKTQSNNILIGRIKDRAAANTKSTLFTVQELGQRVSFNTSQNTSEERV